MSNPTKEKNLTDRQLLIEVLRSQCELAKVLFQMNINNNSRESAAELHTRLHKLLPVLK